MTKTVTRRHVNQDSCVQTLIAIDQNGQITVTAETARNVKKKREYVDVQTWFTNIAKAIFPSKRKTSQIRIHLKMIT